MSGFTGLLVIVPFIAIFIIGVVLLVKAIKWKPQQMDVAEYEKIISESEQLQKAEIEQQRELTESLKEVKERLASVEKILQEVE